MARVATVCVAALSFGAIAWSQIADPLPRRGFFGVALAAGDDGTVVVASVHDGSAAAAAGIEPGDVVATVDGRPARSTAETMAMIGAHRGGDRVAIEVVRDGTVHEIVATLAPYPAETMAGADVTYGSVTLGDGTRLRTIASVPTGYGGQWPGVLLLQGGGCGTVDLPWPMPFGIRPLVHLLGTNGFVTMRVEKSGVGDSEGPPCDAIGYHEELEGYRAALAALRAHAAVDPERVFLVGISLGGVFAPILANESDVAGIAVYGTIAYAPPPYPGRSERFFAEFAGVDVLAEWANVDAPVLLLHGEYDEVSPRDGPARIAAAVNGTHPGRATHRELPRLDHCATRHATRDASLGRCGAGEPTGEADRAILAFLEAHG